MTKETFDLAVAALKAQGIDRYALRCEGANRIVYHNNTDSIIIPKDTYVISVTLSRDYAPSGTNFVVTYMNYSDIDSVMENRVPLKETIELLRASGDYSDDTDKFFKQIPVRMELKPGTAGLAPTKDSNGNPTIASGRSGYVTQ